MENKKGVSIIIGYVLLVGFAVALSVGIYQWMKSYVPRDIPECPDGVSVFVNNYECDTNSINLTIKNSGRFGIGGYFIRVSNDSSMSIATIDLSQKIIGGAGKKMGNENIIWFNSQDNPIKPNEEITDKFDTTDIGQIYFVEITPIRFQEEKNKIRFVTCGDAKSKNEIKC